MLVAANLDPAANDHPDKLDLARRPNRHVAFGTGIHFCLGHQLARIEARCALEALFKRWPKLALAVDLSQIRWQRQPGLRTMTPVRGLSCRITPGRLVLNALCNGAVARLFYRVSVTIGPTNRVAMAFVLACAGNEKSTKKMNAEIVFMKSPRL